MEWWLVLSLIAGALLFLLALGVPIALAFVAVNVVALYLFAGGPRFFGLMTSGTFESVNSFVLIAVPMFMLMGEILFRAGFVKIAIGALDAVIGRVPGRIPLLTIGTGTLLAVLSGTSLGTTATLGTALVPEMVRQGYRGWLTYGSALGGGALAVLIPPSALAIFLAYLGQISAAKVLMGGALPGLAIAALYGAFVVGICSIRPQLAPAGASALPRMRPMERAFAVAKAAPLTLIVFLVTAAIFLGIATPSEAAALGAVGAFFLAMAYGRLDWPITREAGLSAAKLTGLIFLIIAGSRTFSQVLSLTGVASKMAESVLGLSLPPLAIVAGMLLTVIIMGCFIDSVSIMMITVPLYLPIAVGLGFDEIWFAVLMLVGVELAGITPPVGLLLFTLKGVYPAASMGEIYRGALPFVAIQLLIFLSILFFPPIALWLPSIMR